MTFSAASILTLSLQCAPNVAPQTVAALVMTESRGRPFALNINGGPPVKQPSNAADAAAVARRFVAAGYSVDLGLGQINSRNMRKLGLTWATVFDPCMNIAALGRILTGNYEAALEGRAPQAALRVAFSLYNTGSPLRGFRNGYVDKVVANAGVADFTYGQVVSLPVGGSSDARMPIMAENTSPVTIVADLARRPPAWDVFERGALARQTALQSAALRRESVWAD